MRSALNIMWELLTILLLTVHLLAMNVASAGPLIAAWLRWRSGPLANLVGRQLAWGSTAGLILGAVSGGLLLYTVPGNELWTALRRFPAEAYQFAAAELVFSLVCMVVAATVWNALNRWWIALLAFVSATNLLYHFPPMMIVIGRLAIDPRWTQKEIIDRPQLLELMARDEVIPLSVHFALSAIALPAIAALLLITWRDESPESHAERMSLARVTAGISLLATVLQVPVGLWLLTSLPQSSRSLLMGTNLVASLAFLLAIATSIALMQRLLAIAIGEIDHRNIRSAAVLVCVIVFLMTTSLRLSRPISPQAETTKTASSAIALVNFTRPLPVLFWHHPANRREVCPL